MTAASDSNLQACGRKRSMPCPILPSTSKAPTTIISSSKPTQTTTQLKQHGEAVVTTNTVQSRPGHATKKRKLADVSPAMCLRALFGRIGSVNTSPMSFKKPSEEEVEAYDLDAVRAIRSGDISRLKKLHEEGKNLNACNQFGESLLHMACRRGNHSIVSFMLREAKVRTDIRDDFGRNPVHDACWTATPNFELMDILIEHVDPTMLLSEDVRGSTPFDYVRRNHWIDWVKYLASRRNTLRSQIEQAKSVAAPVINS